MKKSEIQDIHGASLEDLTKMLREYRDKLQVLRFDLYAGKIKNVNEVRRVKKSIARVATQLSVLRNST